VICLKLLRVHNPGARQTWAFYFQYLCQKLSQGIFFKKQVVGITLNPYFMDAQGKSRQESSSSWASQIRMKG
jgi:hypothetical protein